MSENMRCKNCRHFLPWRRPEAKHPIESTRGDCHHPRLRGHLNGIEREFGCRFYASVVSERSDRSWETIRQLRAERQK